MGQLKKNNRLYNRINREQLKKQLEAETFTRTTISFYQYSQLNRLSEMRDYLYQQLFELAVFGRIYLATEGINAQVSVPDHNLKQFELLLTSIPEFNNIKLNLAVNDNGKSFSLLKVKIKNKIVADGITDKNFNVSNNGQYLSALEFNSLSDQNQDLLVVDMRNHYEFEVGHFENAISIPSNTFKEQIKLLTTMLEAEKNKKIVMYCTGGIRCEKATAWLKYNGFNQVYHLKGGIINYVNQVKQLGLNNKFIGKNFVFDQRLGESISNEVIARCHQCGSICDNHTNCAYDGCHLLFIQCDYCKKLFDGCCSEKCQSITKLPVTEQKILKQGVKVGSKIFNKAKTKLNRHSKDDR